MSDIQRHNSTNSSRDMAAHLPNGVMGGNSDDGGGGGGGGADWMSGMSRAPMNHRVPEFVPSMGSYPHQMVGGMQDGNPMNSDPVFSSPMMGMNQGMTQAMNHQGMAQAMNQGMGQSMAHHMSQGMGMNPGMGQGMNQGMNPSMNQVMNGFNGMNIHDGGGGGHHLQGGGHNPHMGHPLMAGGHPMGGGSGVDYMGGGGGHGMGHGGHPMTGHPNHPYMSAASGAGGGPHHHSQLTGGGGMNAGMSAPPPQSAVSGPVSNNYMEVNTIMADGGHKYGVTSLSFDTYEELLWMGNGGGHLTSYFAAGLQKYTSCQIASTTDEIVQLLPVEKSILALTRDSIISRQR